MTSLRLNVLIVSVIIGGVVFFFVALLRINPDDLGPVFALMLFPFAFKDIRFLVVSWFILSVYYAKSGVDVPPNIAANISHNMFVPAATVITALVYRFHKRKLLFGIEDLFLVLFVAYCIASAVTHAPDTYDDIRRTFLNFVLPFCLYWMVKNMEIDGWLLKAFAIASLFHLVVLLPIGIYEYQSATSLFHERTVWADVGGRGRIAGPLGSPIILGVLLPILFLWVYTAFRLNMLPRYVLWMSGAIAGLLTLLTFTRSVWLGAFLALVFVMYKTTYDLKKRVLRVAGFAGAALLIVAVITLSSPGVEQRLTGEENANFRIVMAEASLDMIAESPLFGWGSGTFDEIVQRFLFDARGVYIVEDTSHVTLLTLLAELGLVGVLPLLAFIYHVLRHKGIRFSDLPQDDQLIIVVNIGGMITFIINAFLIDMRFYSIAYAWFFINLAMYQNIYRDNMTIISNNSEHQ